MVTVCVIVGIALLIGGIIIACATRNSGTSRSSATPPPLPTRSNSVTPLRTANQPRIRSNRPSSASALPPRRTLPSNSVYTSRNTLTACCGPRGVQPAQFPCCPFDKQRNVPGERQLIFWDNNANCYYCSRGHKFKSNGKLLLAN